MKFLTAMGLLTLFSLSLYAQQTDTAAKEDRFSIHAQTTVINQTKPAFMAPYSGDNSLLTQKESKTSITSTLFMGAKLWKGASVFLNPEIAGGSGLSSVLGIGDATNGETFRVGTTEPKIYLARLFYRQLFALSHTQSYQLSGFNQLGQPLPETYLAVTIGKIGAADYFDNNTFSHDPRTQFMCWSLMSNGGWDYPANTRGYAPSFVLEYVSPKHELHYEFSLVPLTANGNDMNWTISKAGSHTVEYTHRHALNNQPGAIRLLGFYTRANMGNYQQSLALAPRNPDITSTRNYGNRKVGFGINAEQSITENLGGFFRASWNDGKNETWMFTEIDHSISAGLVWSGNKWKREKDKLGIAHVASGLSKPHRDYLKAGGKGFMLGDGTLHYAWEQLSEMYYSAELIPNRFYLTGAYQLLWNPGYNRDRQGPVNVFSIRVHTQI